MAERFLSPTARQALATIGETWAVTYVPARMLQQLVDRHLIEVEIVDARYRARLTPRAKVDG